MTGDGEGFESASYLREYVKGNVVNNPEVKPHAGLIPDEKLRKWITWMANHYEPKNSEMARKAPTFWDTRFAKELMEMYGTETAQRAIDEGHMHTIEYLTGLPGEQADISIMDTIEWLREWITRIAGITLVTGHMGTGKTDFALFLAAVWRMETGGRVVSNITTCPQTYPIERMSELKEIVMESKDEPILFVFDEAASHASSDLDDHETKEQMRQLIRFLRKYNSDIIVIGHQHGGKDLNTEFRRFGEAVKKTSKKKATVYGEIEDRQYKDEKRTISGIPPVEDFAGWDFDTTETSSWKWDLEGDELELTEEGEEDEQEKDPFPDDGVCLEDGCEIKLNREHHPYGYCSEHG